ncbi:AraC-type DNA-binding protein [Tenacibaculum sp. MAR_2009_124]|uniref:helix-turn-helix domain-containing protein n=1 Tax=Tenacibaculum sp. MAR_2009_124 TaxID=1250059 RepID=UPI00089B70F4|nr:helix-turn-helix domain-containing protein [Tenacibaculum sp. MAR_2009_124]SEB43042.1 AraC-type DNA-binding protein [Tenacibaculum sp. MAR_2009_124]
MFFKFGIFIAIFLVILLILKRNKTNSDRILGYWLCLMAVHLFFFYLRDSELMVEMPYLIGVDFVFPILQSVFLYFYARSITGNGLSIKKTLVHLIPTFILLITSIPFFMLDDETKIDIVIRRTNHDYDWYDYLSTIFVIISGFAYCVTTLFLIEEHKKNILHRFSNTDNKELIWLKNLTIGLLIIWLSVFITDNPAIIFSLVVLFVLFIGFFGINQTSIFSSQPINKEELNISSQNTSDNIVDASVSEITISNVKRQYVKSGLTTQMSNGIYKLLRSKMQMEKLFLNNELTLTELAKKLEVKSNHLSQVINERENKNFYNYINTLRVNEFLQIHKAPENKNLTILAIALNCGFKSKSTFNKHFKLITGKTPKDYINS